MRFSVAAIAHSEHRSGPFFGGEEGDGVSAYVAQAQPPIRAYGGKVLKTRRRRSPGFKLHSRLPSLSLGHTLQTRYGDSGRGFSFKRAIDRTAVNQTELSNHDCSKTTFHGVFAMNARNSFP